jgi:hypothetical protein
MTTTPATTFRLDPLHPQLLVCEACGRTVCAVDPSATEQVEGIAGTQAARAWTEQAEVIRTHEVACFLPRDQAGGGPSEGYWHARGTGGVTTKRIRQLSIQGGRGAGYPGHRHQGQPVAAVSG